jgi:hypothetical protein
MMTQAVPATGQCDYRRGIPTLWRSLAVPIAAAASRPRVYGYAIAFGTNNGASADWDQSGNNCGECFPRYEVKKFFRSSMNERPSPGRAWYWL